MYIYKNVKLKLLIYYIFNIVLLINILKKILWNYYINYKEILLNFTTKYFFILFFNKY